eukprot:scaffold8943_cov20-Tisochrysis_lutea.AAC.1
MQPCEYFFLTVPEGENSNGQQQAFPALQLPHIAHPSVTPAPPASNLNGIGHPENAAFGCTVNGRRMHKFTIHPNDKKMSFFPSLYMTRLMTRVKVISKDAEVAKALLESHQIGSDYKGPLRSTKLSKLRKTGEPFSNSWPVPYK